MPGGRRSRAGGGPERARRTTAVRTTVLALALALVPGVLALPASAAPSPSPSPTEVEIPAVAPPVSLELTDLAPAFALPGDTLVLTGTLTNTSETDFVDPTLRIDVQQAVPTTTSAMERWFDTTTGPRGRTVVTADYGVTVPAGGSAPFSFSVPVADLGFPIRFDNWGARGLQVALTAGGRTAVARTVGVFHPGEEVREPDLGLGILVPLTPSAQEWTTAVETGRSIEQVAGDRIRDVVEAAGPAASWALDPALLTVPTSPSGGSSQNEGDDAAGDDGEGDGAAGTGDPTDPGATGDDGQPADPADPADPTSPQDPADPADPDATDDPEATAEPTDGRLAADLVAAAGGREVLALPWADADVPALAGTGADGRTLLTDARASALETFAAVGLPAVTTTAWPADPGTSQEALSLALRAGYSAVVLEGASSSQEDATAVGARTDLIDQTDQTARVPALVSDARLSAALGGAVPEGATTMSDALASRQHALALTAVMTREATTSRTVLATLDRAVAGELGGDDGAAQLGARAAALTNAPWITTTSLGDAFAMQPDEAEEATSTTLPATADVTSPDFARAVDAVVDGLGTTTGLRGALEHPEVLDDVRHDLATATSSAWRTADVSPAVVTDAAAATLATYTNAVTVAVPASLVDLLAEQSAVPLTLTNTLDQRVTVEVHVDPAQPALRVADVDPVTIEPGSRRACRSRWSPSRTAAPGWTSASRVLTAS
ncbi:hypothetical protein GCM10025875_30650 [Litorihabitans aurantiacus]|uniref:Uncharacterized protein n=1 Tax=Litorihabitans aurantiacus TaxID=1930061 RepID=A0AA37XGB2_9MICO|nr:hypothetical protein GCM10025875_30650 [Litorihabitans aurantiacus]